jgi:predicted ATPase
LLAAKPGSLLLLENPEAHLHPRGQVYIGDLMARAANCGVQVIVETHSDHILNGIRLAVHGGVIPYPDVRLYYFDRANDQMGSSVVSPQIDRNGRIDDWPDGFFDEMDNSLAILLAPAKE